MDTTDSESEESVYSGLSDDPDDSSSDDEDEVSDDASETPQVRVAS